MSNNQRAPLGLIVCAGVGAGLLFGAGIGLLLARPESDPAAETVDELKEHAQKVLNELSVNVSDLVSRSRTLLDDALDQTTATTLPTFSEAPVLETDES